MPPLSDPERLNWYQNALENWKYEGYVLFENDALDWLRAELPAYASRQIAELLYRHVAEHGWGCVDEQPETREQWRGIHEFHHDLCVRIEGRLVYFETRLIILRKSNDSIIAVVNAHDA
jgi:hypothetical protein